MYTVPTLLEKIQDVVCCINSRPITSYSEVCVDTTTPEFGLPAVQTVLKDPVTGEVIAVVYHDLEGNNITDIVIGVVECVIVIPTAPRSLTATPGDEQVYLTWLAPANASGIITYEVFESGLSIGTTSSRNFTHTGLTNGVEYSYTVTATNSAGTSPPSNIATATPFEQLDFYYLQPDGTSRYLQPDGTSHYLIP